MKKIVMFLMVIATGVSGFFVGRMSKESKGEDERVYKFKSYYNMLNQWLYLKQNGKNLSTYFKKNNIKSIAIYGMGEMGNRFYDDLKNSEVEIKYAVDKNVGKAYSQIEIIDMDDEWKEVDAVVVTAIFAFDDICQQISSKTSAPIISLEDIVYEV